MSQFFDNDYCFVCGKKNHRGLQLRFSYKKESNQVDAEICFPDHFQGWAGIVHGGLISTALDEIMVKATEAKGLVCVTAEIIIEFKKPATTNTRYFLSGKIVEIRHKLAFTESHLIDKDKNIIAKARAKFFIVDSK